MTGQRGQGPLVEAALEAQLQLRQLGVRGQREAQFPRPGRAGHPAAEVHRVARDQHAVGQHRTHVDADAQVEAVFGRARVVVAHDGPLQGHHRPRRRGDGLEAEEDAVARGVDHPAALGGDGRVDQVVVALLQLAAGLVTEAREVRRRAHHVAENQREPLLEATGDGLGQHVLEPDQLRHRQLLCEFFEVRHGGTRPYYPAQSMCSPSRRQRHETTAPPAPPTASPRLSSA